MRTRSMKTWSMREVYEDVVYEGGLGGRSMRTRSMREV